MIPHLHVTLATLLVAGSFLASQKLAGTINPISLTLLRFMCATVVLLPIVITRHHWRAKVKSALPRASVLSLFYSAFFICLFESLKTTTTLNTGTLYTLVPFATAMFSIRFFKQPVSLKQVVVYLLGIVGTCWVIFNGSPDQLTSFSLNRGDAIFLVGVLFMCGYSVCTKWLYRDDDMLVLVFCTVLTGSVWLSITLPITGQPLAWYRIQGREYAYMAYLVLGATVATVYLYQKTAITLGPKKTMAYTYLNPAAIALLSYVIEHTPIDPTVLPGIALSSIATVLLQFEHRNKK